MRQVEAEIREVDVTDEHGRVVPGVKAVCTLCGTETESSGRSPGARKRVLALLREHCGMGERNFYIEAE